MQDDRQSGRVLPARRSDGRSVRNPAGEDLGKIEELMIDLPTGRLAYAVISFGGFLGIGDKLFAVPWQALALERAQPRIPHARGPRRVGTSAGIQSRIAGRIWPTPRGALRSTSFTRGAIGTRRHNQPRICSRLGDGSSAWSCLFFLHARRARGSLRFDAAFCRRCSSSPPALSDKFSTALRGAVSDPRRRAGASPISTCSNGGRPAEIYVATASGGIFKSVNEGVSWTPVFDKAGGMLSIGAIAVAPSNPSRRLGRHRRGGQPPELVPGAMASTARSTAARRGKRSGSKRPGTSAGSPSIPTIPSTVYVAAAGHLWGSNPERGVFKTTDGGITWKKVLYRDENTGATDLVIDPKEPKSSSRRCISGSARAGGSTAAAPAAAFFAPSTAAPPGRN